LKKAATIDRVRIGQACSRDARPEMNVWNGIARKPHTFRIFYPTGSDIGLS